MRIKLVAVLAAVSAFTLAGVGNSAGYTGGPVKLADFDQASEMLGGFPANASAIAYWHRTDNTANLPAVVGPPVFPPNPCVPLSKVWNIIRVKVKNPAAQRTALTAVLRQMTKFECTADITRDENQSPPAIIDIRPTP
jgi:hypothetical protein